MSDNASNGKWLIYKKNQCIISALIKNQRLVKANIDQENQFALGNIYLGKVQNVVPNINAAFVEINPGELCYLSLEDVKTPCLINRTYNGKIQSGDELLVQIKQEPMKTKQASVTTNLNITGKYTVISTENTNVSFSHKISKSEKQNFTEKLKQEKILDEKGNWIFTETLFGVIFRTNIQELKDLAPILEELEDSISKMQSVLELGKYRTVYSKIYQGEYSYINHLKNSYDNEYDQIVTDDPEIYSYIKEFLNKQQSEDCEKLKLYKDERLSLPKLYSMETKIQEAIQKKVWLKSGAYLVIEPTEALTVIDINTGKYSGKSQAEATFLKINMEACEEIALQLKLRNLSGIIIIDFINLKNKQDNEQLIHYLKSLLKLDPIKCDFIDMTPLGLVEITRKRVNRTLFEQTKLLSV